MIRKSVCIVGLFGIVMIATLLLSAASPGSSAKSPQPASAEVKVDNFRFGPTTLTVAVGTPVTWTNRDDIHHTVVSTDKVFKSKVLEVRVLPDDRAYWRNADDPWARTDVKMLTTVFQPYKGNKEKIVIVRIDRDAKFANMVNIIDELDLVSLTRFSLQTLTPEEKKEVEPL